MPPTTARRWFVPGDLNGFFGLVVDNLSILGFISAALIGIFGFPAEVVFTRMFPGTAFGVLIGNLIYTWMAHRLARDSGRTDVTAMPLGLDAPTSIGMALLVLGPAFVAFKQQGMDETAAAMATWQLGMASLVVMGMLKLVLSFFGDAITRAVPRAALLASIDGAAHALLRPGALQGRLVVAALGRTRLQVEVGHRFVLAQPQLPFLQVDLAVLDLQFAVLRCRLCLRLLKLLAHLLHLLLHLLDFGRRTLRGF